MITHDPLKVANELKQLLQSDKKRIGFLFGAGTSFAYKEDNTWTIPLITQMTEDVVKWLKDSNKKNKTFIEGLLSEYKDYNIEQIISQLEMVLNVIGNEKYKGFSKDQIDDLVNSIKAHIRDIVKVHDKKPVKYDQLLQVDFAKWIGQAERQYGVEIFTTNYDYLFEIGLEYCGVPYYDGFIGSYEPFFYSGSLEQFNFLPKMTKLWKLHGSIGWSLKDGYDKPSDKRVIRTRNGDDFYIYPSIYKYSSTKKEPYVSLIDRLSAFLQQQEAVLITCGYSFNDNHLNERIMTAINRRESNTAVYAFVFDESKTSVKKGDKNIIESTYSLNEQHTLYKNMASLNDNISVYGRQKAIINKQIGDWKVGQDPMSLGYEEVEGCFEEDVVLDESTPIMKEIDSNDKEHSPSSNGKGTFLLPDYKLFTRFLNSIMFGAVQNDEKQ